MTSLLWMPAVLTPVLLAQRFSASGRIPLSALFRYLRKARERDPTIPDPPIDLSGAYFAVCVLAAAIPNQRDEFFYAGVVVLIGWALAPLRPKHHRLAVWASVMVLAAGIGYGTQLGLAQLQATVDDWVSDWLLRGLAADPYRNNTELGAVGRLKMIDAIVLRVYATQADAPRLKLLHRASFNSLHGTTWTARRAPMAPIEPQEDGTTWQLEPGAPSGSARIVTRLESGKALLALPPGTLRVSALPAVAVRRNGLGAMQIELAGDWSPYVAETSGRIEGYAPPSAEDLALPFGERAEFQRLAAELGLEKHNAVERVRTYFASFSYSTYREAPVPEGRSALADFLRESRSGHCEYFAAATTLLLRAAGVPARYATGFAMQEYSELEGAYVVRARHAHAWTRAFVDGRWIDIDTTPPSWFDAEERLAPP
ncbi:MAG TPA: transglutaminase-like domain-containing protein, partial [Burkholderiales bacterium]|nr:transglutaminase-like domain-containing protein [Burkholderiales bacterium]